MEVGWDGRKEMDNRQWTMGNWQYAMGNSQWAMDNRQWAKSCRDEILVATITPTGTKSRRDGISVAKISVCF